MLTVNENHVPETSIAEIRGMDASTLKDKTR